MGGMSRRSWFKRTGTIAALPLSAFAARITAEGAEIHVKLPALAHGRLRLDLAGPGDTVLTRERAIGVRGQLVFYLTPEEIEARKNGEWGFRISECLPENAQPSWKPRVLTQGHMHLTDTHVVFSGTGLGPTWVESWHPRGEPTT